MRFLTVSGRTFAVVTAAVIALGLSSETQAACYGDNQKLSADAISAFLANPSQALQQNQTGGAGLISQLRDLVASDPATLGPVVNLLNSANVQQQTAIGTALGQASTVCLRPDPTFAQQIQTMLAQATQSADPAAQAFAAVTGNLPTGATGGGGGGGGGAIGGSLAGPGSPTGGGGPLFTFGANASNNIATNYFTGGTSGASGGGSGGGGSTSTTTTFQSVSP
jgi:hypothetical protein